MQMHWMRYLRLLLVLFVLALIAVLLSMSVPRANTSSQLASAGILEYVPASESAKITESYKAFDDNDIDGALAVAENILSRGARPERKLAVQGAGVWNTSYRRGTAGARA